MRYRRSFRIPLRGMHTVLAIVMMDERKKVRLKADLLSLAHHGGLRTRLRGGGGEITDGYVLLPLVPHTASRNADGSRQDHGTQKPPARVGKGFLAHHGGLEPSTPSVGGLCSIHLS